MNDKHEAAEVIATSAHTRIDFAEDAPHDLVQGHTVSIVHTNAGNWIAVCDLNADVGEPVTVVQSMKSSKLKRPGRVLALWKKNGPAGYWPPDIPDRMPLYVIDTSEKKT